MVGTGLPNFLEGEARLTEKPQVFFLLGFYCLQNVCCIERKIAKASLTESSAADNTT